MEDRDIERKRELWREHMQRLAKLSPDEKLRAGAAARRRSLELLRAGIRWQYPDWPPEKVEDEIGLRIHGPVVWEKFRERDRRRDHLPRG